jgi:UDP-2,4-diacetamido-2,4,6-trideoxy-beta-L-altropyranose hydrolase
MTLLLRADGGPTIGAGHVMRCLALAQAWADAGGRATLLSHALPGWLRERVAASGCALLDLGAGPAGADDAAETLAAARRLDADWVAVDGYGFDAPFLDALHRRGPRVLVLDDLADRRRWPVDAILNQNPHAAPELYASAPESVERLLGTRFALLRREFWEPAVEPRRQPERARRVLVSLGGMAARELASRWLPALGRLVADGFDVTLVAGARVEAPTPGPRVLSGVDDMPGLLAATDLAVAAAGSTCWELGCRVVPALLFSLADNQRPVAAALDRAGAGIDLGPHDALGADDVERHVRALAADPGRRRTLADNLAALVDAEGGRRATMRLRGDRLRLRPARPADCRLLFDWVNEPEVRASAFCPEPIPWERHRGWFDDRLAGDRSRIFIALDADDRPAGQVRFDLRGDDEAEIDVSVPAEYRGRGTGSVLIALGADRLFRQSSVKRVHAWIKPDNAGSLRAFERAGFRRVGEGTTRGQLAVHWRLERSR